jgi:predicted dehydrogenase
MMSESGTIVRIGMIGTGGMGVAGHLTAFQQSPYARVVAACDVNPQNVAQAAERFQIPATYTDYLDLLERERLDLVDVATPNNSHAEISLEAISRGVNVLCEKPLGMSRHQTRQMVSAARDMKVKTAVNFSYRNVPAARFIREIIQSGEIGEIHHVIATYTQGWLVDPRTPHAWRLQKSLTGTGVLGDLGSHIIDLARFWTLEFSRVNCHLKTFVAERPLPSGNGSAPVDVDDAASLQVEFANGGTGVIFATRFAFARANSQRAEIYGSKGGLVYDNERPHEIQFAIGGFQARQRQYSTMPVPRPIISGSQSTMQTFVEDLVKHTDTTATFEDGSICQEILDAAEISAETGRWVSVPVD